VSVPATQDRNIRQMGEVDDAGVRHAAPMSNAQGPPARDGAVGDHRGVGDHHTTSPAGIVAFVFTDLEDSTRRWEEDPEAMKADVARHLALVDDVVARHGGRRALEQGAGDSTVAAFTRASHALAAAVDLQAAMHQATWQGPDPLRVRVAVHAGEVDVDHRGGFVGPTMNRCGRLLQASHGGQVLASATVVELGRAGLGGTTLRDLGVHHLRGIDEPVAIVQMSGPGLLDSFPPVRTQEGAARTVPLPDSSFVGRRADIDAAAALVAAIEASAPDARVLATSREPLALKDEVVWRVPSLAVPIHDDGRDLLDTDAGRLLVARIGRVRPGYEPGGADLAALASICRRLDGIPLAIELAAARTATIPPVELAARLAERFTLLGGAGRDVIARQRTLEASVAWSFQLLDADAQRVFRRLSVFAGSFPLGAAVTIAGDGVAAAEDVVLRLLHCSLLVERPGGAEPRLQMLEAVRWFARERLLESGEADAVFAAHLHWAVAVARALGEELEAPGVRAALRGLDLEVDNLRAAMGWALDHGGGRDVQRIVAATPWFWIWRGRIPEADDWLDRAEHALARHAAGGPDPGPDGDTDADADPDPGRQEELALRWVRAELALNTADATDRAERAVAAGLELARAVGDQRAEVRFLASGSRREAVLDPLPLLEGGDELARRCREVGDPFWEAVSLVNQSLALFTVGRFDLAEPVLDQLRTRAVALGHPQLVADEIARRVIVDRRFSRYDAVRDAVVAVEAVTAGFTDLNCGALVHAAAAFVDVAQGRADRALQTMEDRFERYVAAGEYSYLPSLALPMMEALIDLDRPAEVLERFEPLWRVCRRTISWRLRMGTVWATAHLAAGHTDRARDEFEGVLEAERGTENLHERAIARYFLGAMDRDDQQFARAEAQLHEALAIQAGFGYPQYVADVLEELAGLELVHDRLQAAATLFGAAARIRNGSGVVRRVGRQAAYEADLRLLHERLADEQRHEAWDQGEALSMADAVALAQRGRGQRGRPTLGWESLTPTEAKVADLVAQGRTNPEIADQLLMGRATVKTHVSNILRKLDLTNRTQLATLAATRDR
jgi:predicted ATPase/class 3 adenylate cyclase/DNA-binding CsgD family transcriptional regulator